MLAVLGATHDSFVQAAQVLERLPLVHVSANSVRDATEPRGARRLAQQAQPQSERAPRLPAHPRTTRPRRLSSTMDGVLAHLHARGWSEVKVGCWEPTRSRVNRKRPERREIRAHRARYVTTRDAAPRFGWRRWPAAVRRGVLSRDAVVVLGDGAHGIWNIAATHFPRAPQIVDW